jgi:hypothetical protein
VNQEATAGWKLERLIEFWVPIDGGEGAEDTLDFNRNSGRCIPDGSK